MGSSGTRIKRPPGYGYPTYPNNYGGIYSGHNNYGLYGNNYAPPPPPYYQQSDCPNTNCQCDSYNRCDQSNCCNRPSQCNSYNQCRESDRCNRCNRYDIDYDSCSSYDSYDEDYDYSHSRKKRPRRVQYHIHEHYQRETPIDSIISTRKIIKPFIKIQSQPALVPYICNDDNLFQTRPRTRKVCYYN